MCEIKKFIRHIVYLNIVVSIAIGTLSAGFAFAFQVRFWILYGIFSFFSTMAVYNGQRVFKVKGSKPTPWLVWVDKNKKHLLLLSTCCLLVALTIFMVLPKTIITLVFLGLTGAVSILYVLEVGGITIRQVPHLKIHLIGLSWSTLVVLFPLTNHSIDIDLWFVFAVFVAHYLYVLAVTIPFDIRDLKFDAPNQKTIPQVIGVRNSQIVSLFSLVGSALILIFTGAVDFTNSVFYFAIFAQMILVIFMNERRSDLYCAGLIDGSIALLGASYFFN